MIVIPFRFAAFLVTVAVATAGASAPSLAIDLEIQVVDGSGEPLDGVEVTVRGSGAEQMHDGGLLGRLALTLPGGSYDLGFSRPDYYDLEIREVVIDPESRSPGSRERLAPLRVMMTRRLVFEKDLLIVGPRYVDPPPIEISFRPQSPVASGQPASGVITLVNVGPEPLPVPSDRNFEWTPETLVMRLVVAIEGSDAAFDEPFVCTPPEGCRELAPGDSIEIPVRLSSRRGYLEGRSEATSWKQERGELKGTVGVYFAFPQEDAEVPTYTRTIETVFRFSSEGSS